MLDETNICDVLDESNIWKDITCSLRSPLNKITVKHQQTSSGAYLRPCQTSMMELFAASYSSQRLRLKCLTKSQIHLLEFDFCNILCWAHACSELIESSNHCTVVIYLFRINKIIPLKAPNAALAVIIDDIINYWSIKTTS